MSPFRLTLFILLNTMSLCVFPRFTLATTVLPMNLSQLTERAQTIFYGRALNNTVKYDQTSGQIVTYTEFAVIDTIKGTLQYPEKQRHIIKQLGGTLPANQQSGRLHALRVHGVPRFQTGTEYILFLPAPSKLGFCSPIGLQQGRFTVQTIQGIRQVSNGSVISAPLTADQATANTPTQARSPIISLPLAQGNTARQAQLDDFLQTLRAMTFDPSSKPTPLAK